MASSGIGEQIVYVYAKSGCSIALLGKRQDKLELVALECKTLNPK
jgi:NADP-dependent 3-hydroxy acid dehydrogenase YdfG